ncbi:hypothetical protein Desti_2092 [Desulfomonile tiedjei DSM 6799]|uniref:Uncharacterized protein n=1 Tax=Desulfomonile tiedjei (strain ATCC 49306 / DSM 6799 / DCB-1) TaxID=706587 RepID=I4C5F0_DESTA|nr:hypothetical protein Desti_2092 [Desulfomonile tiedjei DSM 6799]
MISGCRPAPKVLDFFAVFIFCQAILPFLKYSRHSQNRSVRNAAYPQDICNRIGSLPHQSRLPAKAINYDNHFFFNPSIITSPWRVRARILLALRVPGSFLTIFLLQLGASYVPCTGFEEFRK